MVKIICEGDDDKSFIRQLLQHLKKEEVIPSNIVNFDSYIQSMKGKSNLLDSEKYLTIEKQIGKKN